MAFEKIASGQYAEKVLKKISIGCQETPIFRGDSHSLSIYCDQIGRASKLQRSPHCWNSEMLAVLAGENRQEIPKYTFVWKCATSLHDDESW